MIPSHLKSLHDLGRSPGRVAFIFPPLIRRQFCSLCSWCSPQMQDSPKDDVLGDFARRPVAWQKPSSQLLIRHGSDRALERLLIILPTNENARLRDCGPGCHTSYLLRIAALRFVGRAALPVTGTTASNALGEPLSKRARASRLNLRHLLGACPKRRNAALNPNVGTSYSERREREICSMAKLVYGLNQSLDGYVDHTKLGPPTPAAFRHFIELVRGLTGVIYGTRMYEIMRYWDEDLPDWDAEDRDFAVAWRSLPKWVVSRSLQSVGPNATLIAKDFENVIRGLKAELAGELQVGGPVLAQSLTEAGLIDEYRLYLRPVVLGGGKPLFAGPRPPLHLVPAI